MITSTPNRLLLLLLIPLTLFTACGQAAQSGGFVVGCSNNTAGMVMNYALMHSGVEGLSTQSSDSLTSYLLMDCCSPKSTWSLTTGELDAAVLCPDAAESFLAESKGYLLAGSLTWGTEAVVYKEGAASLKRIGYMSGQERQRRALEALYPDAQLMPVLATSLAYALHVDEVDAAVLDVAAAATLDYPYIPLADASPTAVLVVSEALYQSPEYPALLLAWENASAAIGEFEPFKEAMGFLFSEEMGRKEYEQWLLADEKKFQVPGQPATPPKTGTTSSSTGSPLSRFWRCSAPSGLSRATAPPTT